MITIRLFNRSVNSVFSRKNLASKTPRFCYDCTLKKENMGLTQERGYWKKMHEKAIGREEELKKENVELRGKIKYLKQQLYGRKSENKNRSDIFNSDEKKKETKRNKGHQPGNPGHGRRSYDHLPLVEEIYDLEEDDKECFVCGLPFKQFPNTEDSEEIEIEVKAYHRKIRRKKYLKTCQCPTVPGIITAPGPPKLIPKGKLGISVWVMILLEKYQYQHPINRGLKNLSTYGIDIPAGTVGDGLKKIAPLFQPVEQAIREKNLGEDWWHADETRWFVLEMPDGKLTHRWYLWVFVSKSAVVYILDPSRSTRVVTDYMDTIKKGIIIADRYEVYKSFVKNRKKVLLAFCWAHVRRDFLNIAVSWSKLEPWSMKWVEKIGNLYHLNNLRLEYPKGSESFTKADQGLRKAMNEMKEQREEELDCPKTHMAGKKVLKSLKKHWKGLNVFVDHPHIPMDNNEAERMIRNVALGRKNYYGSGAIWSGHFTACMFSIFQTLLRWNINPRKWLLEYLTACANMGGAPPEDISSFLPWKMSDEKLKEIRLAHKKDDTS